MKTTRGFTLIELMITLMVAAIIVAFAAPSFQSMLMNNRLLAQTQALANALNYARNTALSQNVQTEVCPVGAVNSTTCGTNWATGWMIVLNPTGNPATPATALLQSVQTQGNGDVVSNVNNPGPIFSVTFDARGIATTAAQFVVCDSRGSAYARSVEVLPTGFVQTSATPGMAVWNGNAVACP